MSEYRAVRISCLWCQKTVLLECGHESYVCQHCGQVGPAPDHHPFAFVAGLPPWTWRDELRFRWRLLVWKVAGWLSR